MQTKIQLNLNLSRVLNNRTQQNDQQIAKV